MKIQEADAKSLLVAQGLPVPAWEVAHTVDEARAAAERFLAGRRRQGRDQGPGPRRRPRQGRRREARRLGRRGRDGRRRDPRHGHQGHDRPQGARRPGRGHRQGVLPVGGPRPGRRGRILLMGSAEGGVEIEQVAVDQPGGDRPRSTPTRCSACSTTRPASSRSRWASGAHLQGRRWRSPRASSRRCCAYDADLVEINPLAIVREHRRGRRRRSSGSSASTPRSRSTTRRSPATRSSRTLRDPDEEDPADREAREAGLTFIKLDGDDRLHGQRRRPGDDHDGPRQARRRRAGQLPRHRRRRPGGQGRRRRCGSS